MKQRFTFTVDIEGSLEDLESLKNQLDLAISREVRSAEGVSFSNAESKAIELTEPRRGIHPISPSVDYQNFPDGRTN